MSRTNSDANAVSGFLVINPRSGTDDSADELRAAAERMGVETHLLGEGEDPGEVARKAPEGPLGVAGGDGSLAAVAEVAIERGSPFVVVPSGTLNHFARDLGLDRNEPESALRAFSGREIRVDVGRVNDRLFLNNVSLGALCAARPRGGRGRPFARLGPSGCCSASLAGSGSRSTGSCAHDACSSSEQLLRVDVLSIGQRERIDEGTAPPLSRAWILPSPGRSVRARTSTSTPEREGWRRRSTASRRC